MALIAWKAFRFFDASTLPLPSDDNSSTLDQSSITCITSGSEHIFVGTPQGTLRVLDRSFNVMQSFTAHHNGSLNHIVAVASTQYVITIAEDLLDDPELKVWALDKIEKKSGLPTCLCSLKVQNGRRQFPVSAFAYLPDLTQIAIGFANGSVTIIRGDFIHDRGTKQRTVIDGNEPITALQFRGDVTIQLYIATTSRILTLIISGKGQGSPEKMISEHGCAVGCMIKNKDTGDIIVARDDIIHIYNSRGKGASFGYEGNKKFVEILKDYIVFISPVTNPAKSRLVGLKTDQAISQTTLTVLDPDLKIISYTEVINSTINHMFTAWNIIHLITADGKVLQYKEKPFVQKLELLYQRDHYILAIQLAQRAGLENAKQNVIFRRYGDYLYSKGDYDTAMQQYLKAIDNTEPSQIIRKFLDNQRIKNLIEYLEELHEHGKASSDHTTLLLNCYAKLKDVGKLEAFIKQPGDLKFDLDTAISMCRQAGYSDQAVYLARKHEEHGLVVTILVEDLHKYAETMAYIQRLQPTSAIESATKYATVLLEHEPADMTTFLIEYYSGQFCPKKDVIIEHPQSPAIQSPGYTSIATTAVQNLASLIPLPYMSVDGNVRQNKNGEDQSANNPRIIESSTTKDEYVEYKPPEPRQAFASFVDHQDQFIVFLEAIVVSENIQQKEKPSLYSTLFEIYLGAARKVTNLTEKDKYINKARTLIDSNAVPINSSDILLQSSLADFREGTVMVKEQQKLYLDIFSSYASAKDTAGAIKALQKYGSREPQLYPVALAYFTSSESVMSEARSEIDSILTKIEADKLMAPVQVIQALSQSNVANIGLIKTYLSRMIEREAAEVATDKRLVLSYKNDTENKRKELYDLRTKPTSFSATRCSSCAKPLNLPVVHFLCKHSFHQQCLDTMPGMEIDEDEEIQCPICGPQNATLKTIKQAQMDSSTRHDLFNDALTKSKNKFGTIAEWFGRGVMSNNSTV